MIDCEILQDITTDHNLCGTQERELLKVIAMIKQGRLIELPCAAGDKLYRVTYPYRQPPKVTEFTVKNFRTIGKGQKLQLEVQAHCVPVKNWMSFNKFHVTKEEAEKELEEKLRKLGYVND